MLALEPVAISPSPALVTNASTGADQRDRYLFLTPLGQVVWVDNPEAATTFGSMREATRMAMRLPSSLRAFGLPREPELALRRMH